MSSEQDTPPVPAPPSASLAPTHPAPGPGDTGQVVRELIASIVSTENAATVASDSQPSPSAPRAGLALGRELGRGGMAIVSLAVQRDLAREVAVKRARPDRDTRAGQLIEEARLTGALEHPAIVPVHFLSFDAAGQPLVVLKRVEGEPWAGLLLQPTLVQERYGLPALEWHLRVLSTVCDALGFAHARGVIHRDVKPANVMVGAFGEVYVTDWGLGGTLTRDPEARWPCVADTPGGGTPAYMAPEQLRFEPLAPTTDVWLVGACLYEVLYGFPPYPLRTRVDPADASGPEPHFAPTVRADVLAVCRKALAPAPQDRHQSMRELKLALEACAQHSDSERLAARAARLADDAKAKRAAGAAVDADSLAAEAAYTLRAALELWPDNATAASTRLALVEARAGWALADGQPGVAQALLRELPEPPAALQRQVAAAVEEAARLQSKARGLDPALGRTQRFRFVLGVVSLMALFNGLRLVWPELYTQPWSLAAASVVFLLGFFGLTLAHRPLLDSSALNRQLARLVLVTTIAQVSSRTTAAVFGWTRGQAVTVDLSLIALTLMVAAAVFHWAFAIGALVCFLGQVAALLVPSAAEPIFAVTTLASVLGVGAALRRWGRSASDVTRPPRRP